MQLVKPRARWISPGNIMVTHPTPADGWVVFGGELDQAVRDWLRLTVKSMCARMPEPLGEMVAL